MNIKKIAFLENQNQNESNKYFLVNNYFVMKNNILIIDENIVTKLKNLFDIEKVKEIEHHINFYQSIKEYKNKYSDFYLSIKDIETKLEFLDEDLILEILNENYLHNKDYTYLLNEYKQKYSTIYKNIELKKELIQNIINHFIYLDKDYLFQDKVFFEIIVKTIDEEVKFKSNKEKENYKKLLNVFIQEHMKHPSVSVKIATSKSELISSQSFKMFYENVVCKFKNKNGNFRFLELFAKNDNPNIPQDIYVNIYYDNFKIKNINNIAKILIKNSNVNEQLKFKIFSKHQFDYSTIEFFLEKMKNKYSNNYFMGLINMILIANPYKELIKYVVSLNFLDRKTINLLFQLKDNNQQLFIKNKEIVDIFSKNLSVNMKIDDYRKIEEYVKINNNLRFNFLKLNEK